MRQKFTTALAAWALVSTTEQDIYMWVNSVWEQVAVSPGTIVNLIVYDESTPYTPPTDTVLIEVPDTARIGDTGY